MTGGHAVADESHFRACFFEFRLSAVLDDLSKT